MAIPSKNRANEHPLVVVRVVVVRQSDKDIRLVGQELEPATIKGYFCLAMTRCHVRSAVVMKLLDGQFVLNAHAVTSLVTLTLPLRIAVTLPVALIISRS